MAGHLKVVNNLIPPIFGFTPVPLAHEIEILKGAHYLIFYQSLLTLPSSPSILSRMKRIAITVFICMMAGAMAFTNGFANEAEHKKEWCSKHNGEIDYKTGDNINVDCLTDTHAVEFSSGAKWRQAITQSNRNSFDTGKTPGIVLIIETAQDKKHLKQLRGVIEKRRLGIKTWTVGLEVEWPCDIKGDIDNDGDKIYHIPGQQMYDATVINPKQGEIWFCSYEEAEAAGWKAFVEKKQSLPQTLGGHRELY